MKILFSLIFLFQAPLLCAQNQAAIQLGKDLVEVKTRLAETIEVIKIGGFGGPQRSTVKTPDDFVSINQYLQDKLTVFFKCDECSQNSVQNNISFEVVSGRVNIGQKNNYENVYGNGLGIYRLGMPQCAFHGLMVNINDSSNSQYVRFYSNHPFDTVKSKYKERSRCTLNDFMKLHGIKWRKSFIKYDRKEKELLYRLMLDRIWDNLLEAMLQNGVVEFSDEFAYRAIAAQADDLLIIEKNEEGAYVVEGKVLESENLSKAVYQQAEKAKKYKVLLGFESKKSFTYKDLKVFKPYFKKKNVGLYRLGPQSEMIKVNW